MSLQIIRRLREVKRLRADRAEQELRRARARLTQAEAAVAEARRVLAAWIEEMPRRTAAIYDAVIGKELDLEDLDELKRRVIALSEQQRLLEHRVQEMEGDARKARDGVTTAEANMTKARRALGKFDELVEVLRKAELIETEKREDAELEEAAEQAAQRAEEDQDDLDWAA
jgi:type III secretion protein O